MLKILEFAALRGALAAAQTASPGFCEGLARLAARAAFCVDARHRERARSHLRLAYSTSRTEREIRDLSLACFEEVARNATLFARMLRGEGGRVALSGVEVIRKAHAGGKGVVVIGAHLGPFCLLAPLARQLGIPATVVLKRQKNGHLLRWFADAVRRRFDIEVLLKKDAPAQAAGVLRRGRALVLFADQHPISGGVPCRFFGRPVEAPSGPGVLARRSGAPLVMVTITSRVSGEPEARFDGPVSTTGTLREITQRWMDLLEARIREHPEQWMWMHRRWRDNGSPG